MMKAFKKRLTVLSSAMLLALFMALLAGCGGNGVQNQGAPANMTQDPSTGIQSSMNNNTDRPKTDSQTTAEGVAPAADDTDSDGIPDSIEKTYGTNPNHADTDGDGVNDKQDNEPVSAANPIDETSTVTMQVAIKDARVEDNATADHLEISITNNGKNEYSNFDIYYTISDKITNQKESYYRKLEGFSIKPGDTQTLHFDNKVSQSGHYDGNMNGLYGTSSNGLTFDIILHCYGFKPYEFSVEKAKGTAEVVD